MGNIDPKMKVLDIIKLYPQTEEIFIKYSIKELDKNLSVESFCIENSISFFTFWKELGLMTKKGKCYNPYREKLNSELTNVNENLKSRHGCISFWLYCSILVNFVLLILFVYSFLFASNDESYVWCIYSMLSLANMLGAILILNWNRLGFYILLFNFIITAVFNVALGYSSFSTAVSTMAMSGAIWCGILQIKKNGISAWKLLNLDLDFSKSKKIYATFIVMFVLIIMCVFFKYFVI